MLKINIHLSLFLFFLIFSSVEAKMVNGIAMIIEGEPVTVSEIRTLQHSKRISKAKAVDILILDRLQKAAMKNISLSENAIDEKISGIAALNHVSIIQMREILENRGTSWSQYRSTIRNAMKREKFYKETVIGSIPKPSEDELRLFYKHHKKTFTHPSIIRMTEYSTEDEDTMKHFFRTKNKKGIQTRSIIKKTKDLNPALLEMLLKTKTGNFTPPFNAGERYVMFKIRSKSGKLPITFEAAKSTVLEKWRAQQQTKALKEYFEKLKTNANIQVVR